MGQKMVPDLIYEKIDEYLKADELFKDISADLITQISSKKKSEKKISELLKKVKNEDTEFGD